MKKTIIFISLAMFCTFQAFSQGIIINHTCTKITQIPESAIQSAKQKLHIAYGHTSHGSQLTEGMYGMIAFMNGKGYTNNLYSFNDGGTGGALDLHDGAMSGDVGYYPDWVNNTRNYLGTPNPVTGRGTGTYADVNVIIWSWCGQVSGKYQAGTLYSEYINPMVQLETDYFGIKFVYMTGHLDYGQDANNKAANQVIRDFCVANNKILYDFSDIESYDPDDTYYQYAGDDCSYYSASGVLLGNWATEWQNSHTVNVDWYNCGSQHSQPLNANRKAYAAWWLWARLAGWDASTTVDSLAPSVPTNLVSSNITSNSFTLSWTVSTDNVGVTGYEIFRDGVSVGVSASTSYNVTGLSASTAYAMTVKAKDGANNISTASSPLNVTTLVPDLEAPSVPANLNSLSITETGFTLSWSASTDNVGVTGYEIFKDNVLIGTSISTSYNVTGLTCSTTYAFTVRAKDAALNWSNQSIALNVTTSSCPDVLVTARGGNSASNEGIDKIYDDNLSTKWLDFSATSWVQWQYSTPRIWNSYDITSGNDAQERDPKDWVLKGSNDGTNWTVLDNQTNESWVSRNQTSTYNFNNSTAYNYYRWEISANQSGTVIQVSEFIFNIATQLSTEGISDLLAYPNPVTKSGQLTVKASTDDIVSICNMSGVLLYSQTMNADEIKIDTENFTTGIYMINIKSKNKIVIVKFLVQ